MTMYTYLFGATEATALLFGALRYIVQQHSCHVVSIKGTGDIYKHSFGFAVRSGHLDDMPKFKFIFVIS